MISFSSLIPTLVFLLLVDNVIGRPQQRQLQGDDPVLVEAFVCGEDFKQISEDQVVNKGDNLRICIKTHVRAKVQGISIAKVIDFFLLREFENAGDMEQILLQSGVVTSKSDELTCKPGAELCLLDFVPMDSFFGRDGRVSAIGSVLLQYDNDDSSDSLTAMPTTVVVSTAPPTRAPTIPPTADRTETNAPTSAPPQNDTTTTLVTPQSNANHRQLLLPNPPKVILETSFTVVTAGNDTGFLTDFREHWDSSPAYVKVLYVLAFIFFFLILFGLGCGMLTWAGFCNKPLALLFPERFQRDVEGVVPSKSSRDDDDNTIDESVGAFSPFARNNNNKEETEEEEVLFMDHYNDEPQPMPRQIVLQRSMSGSVLSTDIEASVGQEENTFPGGRNPKPRNPATSTGANRSSGGRKSIRDRNRAQKARLARSGNKQTINPNRDLAASFLGGYPKRKLASVRSKSPRSSRSVVRNSVVEDEIPREKTASAVRWLREKDQQKQQQQQQCGRSVSSAPPPRRGVNQQFQGSTHSSGLTPRRGGVVLHGNSIPKPAHAVSNVPPRRRSRGFNQQRRGSSHSVSTAPPRSTRGVNQHNMQGNTHSVSTVPPPRSTRGFNQQDLQGSSHSVSTAPPPRRMSGQQQFQGRKNVSGLARSQGDSPLHNSSPATPPQTKRVVRHEKRVSVDIMPMTPDEIDWAMEDAKTQEEEREIQEIRERIRRRKEAKAKAAAAASAAPRWGAIVSHDGNSIPNPEYQQEPVTPPNKSPTVKRRTSQIPMIPEVETVFSDPESMVETDSESVESVDHDYVETLFLVDENNVPHGRDNPRPID